MLIDARSKPLLKAKHGEVIALDAGPVHTTLSQQARTYLLEGTLGEHVALDASQSLVWVVIGLLHQAQLLTLLLVQPDSHSVLLLQALQGQDEQLGVVLVAQRGEGDESELARLQPVHSGRICRARGNLR